MSRDEARRMLLATLREVYYTSLLQVELELERGGMSDQAVTRLKVTIEDDAYERVQAMIEVCAGLLLDPKLGLGRPSLDLFIERAQRAQDLGPILHPSEWRDGIDKLREVLVHARALRAARDTIAESLA